MTPEHEAYLMATTWYGDFIREPGPDPLDGPDWDSIGKEEY